MIRKLLPIPVALMVLQACNHDVSVIRRDDDGDSWYGEDCNDHDPNIYPGAPEICDGVDNNCDGQIDEDLTQIRFPDGDGDGFGDGSQGEEVCGEPSGFVDDATDCDDLDAAIHPDATEVCDSVDNNCDGQIDEELAQTWYADSDDDGHGDPEAPRDFCEDPQDDFVQEPADDCDDTDADVYPGAPEFCGDDIDQDCDGNDRFCAIQGELELDGDADVSIYGAESGDALGAGLALTPDLNGDGLPELMVGAPLSNHEDGGFYSVSLNEGVTAAVIQLPSAGGSSHSVQTIVSDRNNSETGRVIRPTGDLDGDGWSDLLVTSPDAMNIEGPYDGTQKAGASFIYMADSFSGVSNASDDAQMTIYGQTRNGNSSSFAGSLGDLSGDGFPELFVSEPTGDGDWADDSGNVYIFHTCPEGIGGCWDSDGDGAPNAISVWGTGQYIEVEDADLVLSGNSAGDSVGVSVVRPTDFYGDGSQTVALGAPGIASVYILDGYPYSSTRIESAASFTLVGEAGLESGGAGTTLSDAGDLNGDGYSDLLIGAPGAESMAGKVYVVFGRSATDFAAFGGTLDLESWSDAQFVGENPGDEAGTALSGIGDQNLDGVDDFIVGAPGVSYDGSMEAGAVYLLLGHPTEMGLGIRELAHLSGSWPEGRLGANIDGSQDVDNDGFRDLFIGAPSYNETGAAFLLFGGAL